MTKDYLRCPCCNNIVAELRPGGGIIIRHAKREYAVPSIETCTCERCGHEWAPESAPRMPLVEALIRDEVLKPGTPPRTTALDRALHLSRAA